MAESKVVSIRIPQDLLDAIDRLAAQAYPSRRSGGEPNRSQVILDALAAYVKPFDDTVNSCHTGGKTEVIDGRLTALVDERLVPVKEKLAALESELEKLGA